MNYLVDTHYLIWSLFDPEKIDTIHQKVLLDPAVVKFVSKISCWEIAVKFSLGKLQLKGITPEDLLPAACEAGYEVYDITTQDLLSYYRLPKSKTHRDPFDRLLIWQCIRNKLVFISADSRVQEYSKHGLQLVNTA